MEFSLPVLGVAGWVLGELELFRSCLLVKTKKVTCDFCKEVRLAEGLPVQKLGARLARAEENLQRGEVRSFPSELF